MPKVPLDYSKTIIYKLVHFDDLNDENIYVGHCTNMTQRKYAHKSKCNNPNDKSYNQKKYQFIRENGGWDQWQMILVEKYPCKDEPEAVLRERYWKRELKATLNTNEPCRNAKEYYEDNKEKIAEYSKQWHQDNRDKILERQKNYRQNNPDKIIESNKKWYENNLEKIHEKKKEKYENNKEEINEKRKQKITCECGNIVRKSEISRHRKSIVHQEWVKNNNLTIK